MGPDSSLRSTDFPAYNFSILLYKFLKMFEFYYKLYFYYYMKKSFVFYKNVNKNLLILKIRYRKYFLLNKILNIIFCFKKNKYSNFLI